MNALAVKPANTPPMRSLRDLLHGLVSDEVLAQVPERLIATMSLDSRTLGSDSLFLAVPGIRSHGLDYAAQAIANGASVVLYEPRPGQPAPVVSGVLTLAIPDLSSLLGQLTDRFHAQPSAAMKIAAVTGTNGKSTTAWLIADAAERCGLSAGYSGTVGYGRINALQSATHTTPDVLSVHRQMAELRDAGAAVVGMEVSSHALHQARIAALRIDTAVFTNLTRDHLDYHGDMQAYGAAKALLFQAPGLRHRVINADDAFGRELLTRPTTAEQTTVYSCRERLQGQRMVYARQVRASDAGLELEITGDAGDAVLGSSLLGRFNAENLLAALAVLLGWNVAMSQAVQALQHAIAPPGRMELLQAGDRRAVVDYAHTPDALEKALTALREHCRGHVICVFGCGGDRDPGKRAQMGAIAARLADSVVLTNDNPRSEDPLNIIAAIQSGMAGADHVVQPDRALAIERALQAAGADDIVLIAGKGHEDYQIIGADTHHFSDREVVRAVLGRAT